MKYDTKVVMIIEENLAMWQKLNVTAFIATGIGGTQPIIGEPYQDGDGIIYLPMCRQPIILYTASAGKMKEILLKSFTKEIQSVIYTEELFETKNDMANRAKVAEFKTEALNLVGVGLYGKKNQIDRIVKGLELHP
ncbi:MAG: hypothetical protein PWP51_1332 [Clostridiales bacterium]|jgi:hypothetical protein|nr:hypothetical protein [Clostridiales bacterium]MDN5298779.1 hypothetical protein [Clostridiales bacterium]